MNSINNLSIDNLQSEEECKKRYINGSIVDENNSSYKEFQSVSFAPHKRKSLKGKNGNAKELNFEIEEKKSKRCSLEINSMKQVNSGD